MTDKDRRGRSETESCLSDHDLYRYVSAEAVESDFEALEQHLASCPDCREELAGLLAILHSEDGKESAPAATDQEINDALAVVQDVSRRERSGRLGIRGWAGWAAAAAAVVATAAGLWAYEHFANLRKAEQFFAEGRNILEGVYAPSSSNGLRLDLPFRSAATSRDAPDGEPWKESEVLFHKALALNENRVEAHLGLGASLLGQGRFSHAAGAFQRALELGADARGSLGRGVARFEEALRSTNPLDRDALLKSAMTDFEIVLRQDPGSLEARYNKITVLYETGRHREAAGEIDAYLLRDPDSLWAARLRDLKAKIELARPKAVEEQVDRAAADRDAALLKKIALLAPDRVPAAIQTALRCSLQREGESPAGAGPSAADLRWAGEVLVNAYAASRQDQSYRRLLAFYDGLSPPMRRLKRDLDSRLTRLLNQYQQGEIPQVLQESETLLGEFTRLSDHWQLLNLHHLRGNCYYYTARFDSAKVEYRRMFDIAERIGSPDLIARSLASLASALGETRELGDRLDVTENLRELAAEHGMDSWSAYALSHLGNTYLIAGSPEKSGAAYVEALGPAYRLGDATVLTSILQSLGGVAEESGRFAKAQKLYELALDKRDLSEVQEATPAVLGSRMNLHHKIGELSLRLGERGKAEEQFTVSLDGARELGMRELECRSLLGLSEVSLVRGRPAQAEMLTDQALRIAEERHYEDLTWRVRFIRGRSLRAAGKTEEALRDLERAIGTVEKMRSRIPAGETRQSFLWQRLDPYREIVAILGGMAGRSALAAEYADRAKSLALRDYLQAGGRTDPTQASQEPDAAITSALPGTFVLEYFFTMDGLMGFASWSGRAVASRLDLSIGAAGSGVEAYLNSLRLGDQAGFEQSARELHRRLVKPLLQRLGGPSQGTLILIPDGPLHRLPFAGLIDDAGRYLVEDYALAYSPSRGILARCLVQERGHAGSLNRSVLLIDGSANLRGAARELSFLAALYGDSTAFWDPRDDGASLGRLRRAEIVHFAGHADLREGRPGLVLDSARGAARIEASEIGDWRLDRSRLVNLAGCSTAVGPQSDGSAPWGLVPALLNAGATSLIASLLPVDDQSTERLNFHFYSCLAGRRTTKAEALRHAQLALLEASAPDRFQPAEWIPFLLLGDPR